MREETGVKRLEAQGPVGTQSWPKEQGKEERNIQNREDETERGRESTRNKEKKVL